MDIEMVWFLCGFVAALAVVAIATMVLSFAARRMQPAHQVADDTDMVGLELERLFHVMHGLGDRLEKVEAWANTGPKVPPKTPRKTPPKTNAKTAA